MGDEVVGTLSRMCQEGLPLETGGILTGYYTADHSTAVVMTAEPAPEDSRRSSRWFERGVRGLKERLFGLWDRPVEDCRYYIGEWHLHPLGPAVPSVQDRQQMMSISESFADCPEPVLIVVGGDSEAWEVGLWVFPKGEDSVELQQMKPAV